jgi:hypothetical protein
MRLAFIGDVHLGNHRQYGGDVVCGMNARFRTILRALDEAIVWANDQGCTDLVILGDVFDTPKPLPQQLAALRSSLVLFHGAVHLLVGNHDRVSGESGDHGLGPLRTLADGGNIDVYDEPTWIGDSTVEVLLCPFDARPVKEWLPPLLENKTAIASAHGQRAPETIVCGHFGLWEHRQAGEQPWLTSAADAAEVDWVARLCSQHAVDHLYVGNYHTHFRWTTHGVFLHQLGALVPTGFDNPGFSYGVVETWPDDKWTLIPGPRFVVVSSGEELGKAASKADATGCFLYADWRVSPEGYTATVEAAEATMLGVDPVSGEPLLPQGSIVEVHVDRKFSKLRAAQAAGAARSSETLTEAMHAFVSKHPMPPHVSREAVLEHVRRFLGC